MGRGKSFSQNGSIIIAIFGAIAAVGVVGAATMNTMKGPVRSMHNVTQKTIAENNMIAAGKLALMAAIYQENGGDCDEDGTIEPLPFSSTGEGPHPTGGGYLPQTIGTAKLDPWGNEYGYCVWDHGTAIRAISCGNDRLRGAEDENGIVLAVMSSGPDRVFQTSCGDAPDYVIRGPASDDIVLAYSYAEAATMSGGLWNLKAGAPNTAQINKDIEVHSSSGNVIFGVDSTTDTNRPAIKVDYIQKLSADRNAVEFLSNVTAPSINIAAGSAYQIDGEDFAKRDGSSTAVGRYSGRFNTGALQSVFGTLAGSSNTGSNQSSFGYSAGEHNKGEDQSAFGYFAGRSNEGGRQSVFGRDSGYRNTGNNQSAFGWQAGSGNKGNNQSVFGYVAGNANTGSDQSAFGSWAGNDNTGSGQSAFGYHAGNDNTARSQSTFGWRSGSGNTGDFQSVFGYQAGSSNTGSNQSAFGLLAGDLNTGVNQSVFGRSAGEQNSGGNQSAFGYLAGFKNKGINQSTFGSGAGYENEGSNQSALGYEAGYRNTGNNLLALGYQAGRYNTLHNQFIVQQTNVNTTPLIQGNFSTGNVGIGTATPQQKLDVAGNIAASGTIAAAAPTANNHLTTKQYVDTRVAAGTGFVETDPKVGALTNNSWCYASGGKIVCDRSAPLTGFTEVDPKVGATTSGKWCRGSGSQVVCDQAAPTGGGSASTQAFTASGTWTKPAGASMVYVQCWGGGGGGGGFSERIMPAASLPASVSVTIGAGGTGGGQGVGVPRGERGGNSTFGNYLTARGGAGGYDPVDGVMGAGGGYPMNNVCQIAQFSGGFAPGKAQAGCPSVFGGGGGGGYTAAGGTSTFGGKGGNGGNPAQAGSPPGGGGGGRAAAGSGVFGAAGARGECRVTTF